MLFLYFSFCLFVYFFFLYPLHCAGTIYTACCRSNKVNARFYWLSSVCRDRAGTCMSSTKLQDKLMLILSLLSPFVITGKAESCRSRKPASAPARNLMNLCDLCRYCCPTQKFCSVKQLAGVSIRFTRVSSFFFFLFLHTLSVSFIKKLASLDKLTRVLERNT